ncbi:NAD(P)H-dependent oxidoreductase [Granulosicoccus sp. 3-233]|uniref:NAD(P)H-dependent oxidoreductase n=1 Tax=Granulosicoccus sp. 3-233 TaxID=3417969 RepID=UPI003D32A457
MKRILILSAHPNPSQSHVNRMMSAMAASLSGVTLVDLYALYPRFKIDIDAEQQRLLEHDVIVFQFPIYWYSTPALLKEWQDLVLEHGFAYGSDGCRLAGKLFLVAATAGAAEHDYAKEGRNHFPMRTLLSPLEQTAQLCRMRYLPPLMLFSSLQASHDERARQHVVRYRQVLEGLRDEQLDIERAMSQELLDHPDVPMLNDSNGRQGDARG